MQYWIGSHRATDEEWANLVKSHYVLAGTGPRDWSASIQDQDKLENLLDKRNNQHGNLLVMSGMAEGFDEFLAVTAVNMGIPLVAAIPNEGYGQHYWGRKSKSGQDRLDHFKKLVEESIAHVFVCDGISENGLNANFVRNQFMVNWANEVVGWYKSNGGTADCIRRVHAAKVPISFLNEQEGNLLT